MTEVGRLNTELVTPINGINPDRYYMDISVCYYSKIYSWTSLL